MHNKKEFCPIVETANLIGKKWTLVVIRYLMDGPKRFNELKRSMQSISSKTLSLALSDLEMKGIINRKVHTGSPIGVEYSLTEKGKDFVHVLEAMKDWGEKWLLE
jgi:DNA-binding HxlR family transcriptional regulator